jgi:hypothetical protein
MLKEALKKMAQGPRARKNWEEAVPFIQLAYNSTPQHSTKVAPTVTMMAQLPTMPSSVMKALEEPLYYTNDVEMHKAACNLLDRAALVQQAGILAADNLEQAQVRDQWRFRQAREGTSKYIRPAPVPGNYVYLSRPAADALTLGTRPTILRVEKVESNGLATLIGRDGRTIKRQIHSLELCLLPNVDPTMRGRDEEYDDIKCQLCDSKEEPECMLLCDTCDLGWHTHCLDPPLRSVPPGFWECPKCEQE